MLVVAKVAALAVAAVASLAALAVVTVANQAVAKVDVVNQAVAKVDVASNAVYFVIGVFVVNSVFEFSVGNCHLFFPAYSTFAGLGAMFFMLYFYGQTLKTGISYCKFLACCFIMGAGMILGSKTLFIVTELPKVFSMFSWKFLWETIVTSGFVFYGGLLGAFLGAWAASRILHLHLAFRELLNSVVPGFLLFHACGRIGCFFTGCCYGVRSRYGFPLEGEPGVTRFPVQLLESSCLFMIFIVLLIMKQKRSTKIVECYLVLYAVCRFVLEFLRGDSVRGIWFGLSTSQWISLGILAWCALHEIKERHQMEPVV